jgi:hypothetical protein
VNIGNLWTLSGLFSSIGEAGCAGLHGTKLGGTLRLEKRLPNKEAARACLRLEAGNTSAVLVRAYLVVWRLRRREEDNRDKR